MGASAEGAVGVGKEQVDAARVGHQPSWLEKPLGPRWPAFGDDANEVR